VSLVRYELRLYIPEDDVRHGHRRQGLKSYNTGVPEHVKIKYNLSRADKPQTNFDGNNVYESV
jgi:hypothetical protein